MCETHSQNHKSHTQASFSKPAVALPGIVYNRGQTYRNSQNPSRKKQRKQRRKQTVHILFCSMRTNHHQQTPDCNEQAAACTLHGCQLETHSPRGGLLTRGTVVRTLGANGTAGFTSFQDCNRQPPSAPALKSPSTRAATPQLPTSTHKDTSSSAVAFCCGSTQGPLTSNAALPCSPRLH